MTSEIYNKTTQDKAILSEDVSLEVPLSNPLRTPAPERVPVPQQLMLLVAILLLLLGGSFTSKILSFFQQNTTEIPNSINTNGTDTQVTQQIQTSNANAPFSNIQLTGTAAYVWDISEQRALYKKNETKQLPLASVTKLMTTLLADEILSEDKTVLVTETAIKQDGDSGLLQDEHFSRKTLSDLVLISSSNDGAYALAAAAGGRLSDKKPAEAFVHAMNVRAKELGLHSTFFRNPTGLDISQNEAGAYGTAKDIAFLMEYIVIHNPDILSITQENEERIYSNDGIYHDAINTNSYINKIPGLIGSKTGYTDLAGGNLVIAFDAGLNRPVIISVLGSTRHDRFIDVQKLVKEVQQYITQ